MIDFQIIIKNILNCIENIKEIFTGKTLENIGKTILILFLMYFAINIGNKIIDGFLRKKEVLPEEASKKIDTFSHLLKSILRYTIYFLGIISILTVYLGPIPLTFAGISGVAIGLGSQNLIKDILNGILILFESQYSVGDCITISDKKGVVESFDLRITKLRSFNGDLHTFSNGSISLVTNHSKGPQQFNVIVTVDYKEDVDNVINILESICNKFDVEYDENILETPTVFGISELGNHGVSIKIQGKSKPLAQSLVESNLRKEIKNTFDKEKIEFAYIKMKAKK